MVKIKFISLEDLLENRVNKNPFKLVDVLSDEAFREGHIPGAINIPLDKLVEQASSYLNKTDTVVVYCGGYACQASTRAAETLLRLGYEKVLDFKAGKMTWVQAGLELER